MRIEFYLTSAAPGKLQWDLTHCNYSAVTGCKSRAYAVDPGEMLCSLGGFFLDPGKSSQKKFPAIPATRKSLLSWLLRCGFFSPTWIVKILLGKESVLHEACLAAPKYFPTTLRGLLLNRKRTDVENYLETLKASRAGERFQEMRREQSIEIATYQNKTVPRMTESE